VVGSKIFKKKFKKVIRRPFDYIMSESGSQLKQKGPEGSAKVHGKFI